MIQGGGLFNIDFGYWKEPAWYTVHEADALSEKDTRSSIFFALTNMKNLPPFSLVLTAFAIEPM